MRKSRKGTPLLLDPVFLNIDKKTAHCQTFEDRPGVFARNSYRPVRYQAKKKSLRIRFPS